MSMDKIIVAAGVVAPIISAGVNVAKEQFNLNGKQVSVTAIVTGVVVGLAYAATIAHGDYAIYGWAGLVAGFSAIGYYELAFKSKNEKE